MHRAFAIDFAAIIVTAIGAAATTARRIAGRPASPEPEAPMRPAPVAKLDTPPRPTIVAGAAGESGVNSSDLLDTRVLAGILSVSAPDDRLLERVMRLYGEHAPRVLRRLAEVDRNDPTAVAEAAHALKSMSRNAGARRIAELAHEIEMAARTGAGFNAVALAKLEDQLEPTLDAIAAFVASAARGDRMPSGSRRTPVPELRSCRRRFAIKPRG